MKYIINFNFLWIKYFLFYINKKLFNIEIKFNINYFFLNLNKFKNIYLIKNFLEFFK